MPREYVIREVIPPRFKDNRYRFDWNNYWFTGDSDGNGKEDFLLEGQWMPDINTSNLGPENLFEFHAGIPFENNRQLFDLSSRFSISSRRWALLKTPGGFQAILSKGPAEDLVAVDWDTGVEIGVVTLPTGFPHGIPDPAAVFTFYNAGDQNGDGYDDFFVH